MQEKENSIRVLWRRSVIFKNFLMSGIKVLFAASYWHDRKILRILIASGILNLALWAYLLANKIEGNFPIILHYNLFFGVDSVGDYGKIFLLPLIGFLVFFLNSFLGQYFYKIEKLAACLLTVNIFIVQIFLMLSGYLVIRVNS